MSEAKVLIFAGTIEGRKLAEYLAERNVQVHVCVATEYGESLLKECLCSDISDKGACDDETTGISQPSQIDQKEQIGQLEQIIHRYMTVTHERMDHIEMAKLIREYEPRYVIDATHPYAQEVTANIRFACDETNAEYLRVLRERSDACQDAIYVSSVDEAVQYLKETSGNILVTTGSKELHKYTELPDYQERVYARVLSTGNVAVACENLGFAGRHLICMQGPFSTEMNLALIKEFDVAYMVTKESGTAGGFLQKYEAAIRGDAKMVVVGRPVEKTGMSYSEIIKFLSIGLSLQINQNITLAGIGMGGKGAVTEEVREACSQADVLIGANRMLDAVKLPGQKTYMAYKADDITEFIASHPEYERIVVVLSGDPGFYSGAKKLLTAIKRKNQETEKLKELVINDNQKTGFCQNNDEKVTCLYGGEHHMKVQVMPGISTVSYLSARLGLPWESTKLVSIHGRNENLLSAIRKHKLTFTLTGSAEDIRTIAQKLIDCGLGNAKLHIGENLSYEDERIQTLSAEECISYDGNPLAAVIIENSQGGEYPVTHGISDEEFLRGNVPMTKEEVRSISLSKMKLKKGDVIYDIGAGTGSISIEAALQASDGYVYAIEVNPEANALIAENSQKFAVDNLTVIEGTAPDALAELPVPDVVFIGGSKGHLEEIMDVIAQKNPNARIVLNAIALETLAQVMQYCNAHAILDEEIVQVNISKSRTLGHYHMMTGQNPIYIISFTLQGKEV